MALKICSFTVRGNSLERISRRNGMPSIDSMVEWQRRHPEFARLMDIARKARADLRAEQVVDIADAATPATERVARLRVDARKWDASKERPEKWGDRVNVSGQVDVTLPPTDRDQYLLETARTVAWVLAQGSRLTKVETPAHLLPAPVAASQAGFEQYQQPDKTTPEQPAEHIVNPNAADQAREDAERERQLDADARHAELQYEREVGMQIRSRSSLPSSYSGGRRPPLTGPKR
jgi:hypothetical protein